MPIDRERIRRLVNEVETMFDLVATRLHLAPEARDWLRRKVMGPALDEVNWLADETRAPVLFFVGRSGHGKSSLVNALAGKQVAEVGHIAPTSGRAVRYSVAFDEMRASWDVVDSRGLFETTRPEGAESGGAERAIERDLLHYRPDVVLHVMSATGVRAAADELRLWDRLMAGVEKKLGAKPPGLLVLTKVDHLENPRDWPPEQSARKAGLIGDLLDYVSEDVFSVRKRTPLDSGAPFRGYAVEHGAYQAIVPVCALAGDLWNIDLLSRYIGERLPEAAQLDYYLALREQALLRKLAERFTQRFSRIAFAVGSAPMPIPDAAVLTPLQLLLVAVIGGIAGRDFSLENARAYLGAAGVNLAGALGLRSLARQALKLVPGAGHLASGAIAASGTYAVGKAAELYFFGGEVRRPQDMAVTWPEHESPADRR